MKLCLDGDVRNVTVSIPDDVYRVARVRAAELGDSLSGIVATYLRTLADADAEFARVETQQRAVVAEIDSFSAADRLKRDEVHDRRVR